jgi:tetratricopeptide (TPR) repeat protein
MPERLIDYLPVFRIGSKEIVVTAPLVVFLYDACCRSGSYGAALRRNRLLYAGLAATWLIPVLLLLRSPRGGTVGFNLGVSSLDYLRTQAGVIIYYLRLCFYPHPLAISYSDWPIVREWKNALIPGITVIVLLGVSTMGVAKRRLWGFAGAFFFLVLSCSSSFIPIVTEPAAERRMYLPLAAVIGVVVVLAERGIARLLELLEARPGTHRALKLGMCLVVAGLLMAGTVMRNADYESAEGLLSKTLVVRPGDELVRGALIDKLIQQKRFADAETIQAAGLARNPRSYILYDTWGRSMMSAGRFDEAVAAFDKVLEIRPNDYRARSGAGAALAEQGRWRDAVEQLREGIRLQPDAYRAHSNLGVALANLGEKDEAIEELRLAVRLKPGFADAQYNLGRLLLERGETREAVVHLRAALRMEPQDTGIAMALGEALEKGGDLDEAVGQYRAILAREANNREALERLQRLGSDARRR